MNVPGDRLPPTLDALVFHLRRANYQAFIWKSACGAVLDLSSPIGNGWQIEDERFCGELTLNSSVSDAIVKLTRCECKQNTNRYKLYESHKEEND